MEQVTESGFLPFSSLNYPRSAYTIGMEPGIIIAAVATPCTGCFLQVISIVRQFGTFAVGVSTFKIQLSLRHI